MCTDKYKVHSSQKSPEDTYKNEEMTIKINWLLSVGPSLS